MIPLDFYVLLLSRKIIDKGFIVQDWKTIKYTLIIMIILFLIRSVVRYGTSIFSTKLELRINQKFQNGLFSNILYLPMRFFSKEPTGQLMSRILEDATRFSMIFNLLFGQGLLRPLRLLALLSFLLFINIRMCVLMLITTFFSILVIRWTGRKIRVISKEIQKTDASIYTFVEQIFPNIELVKSKSTEEKTTRDLRRLIDDMIRLSLNALKVSLISNPILQSLQYIGIGICFAYGSWMISRGQISFGTLTMFLGAAYLFFNSINSLGNSYRTLRENLARMEVIYGIIDSPLERSVIKSGGTQINKVDSIEFRNISFGYKPGLPVLKNVSIRIKRGEMLGITGQSGSGKTTLTRLLLRFFEPDSGGIVLNGVAIEEYDLASLRSSIGIVFQENLILNDSIKKNIAYGNDELNTDSIIKASKTSQAHDFIRMFPDQYNTLVGEDGRSLSGGERQRIAIARAILTDPQIFIMDEGTSFLEVKQEETILKRIRETRKGKITIIISHRLSAIKFTDRILTLDNGKILETDFRTLSEIGINR
jgi:ABC-type multidrug transport system fused ATPase/permease subunit